MRQETKTAAWPKVKLPTVNRTELGVQEWQDALFLRYGLVPLDLSNYCNGCNTTFLVCHALDCKRSNLVTARHKELRDRVADLAGKYFTPSHMRNDLLNFASCAVKRLKVKLARTKGTTIPEKTPPLEDTEQKGDLPIHELWQNGTNSVHDMQLVNTYAKSILAKTPEKCLQEADRAKKKI